MIKKIVSIFLCYSLFAAAVIFCFGFFRFEIPPALPKTSELLYKISNGLSSLLDTLPSICFTGFLLGCSLSFGEHASKAQSRFSSEVSSILKQIIVLAFAITLLVSLCAIVFSPYQKAKQKMMRNIPLVLEEYGKLVMNYNSKNSPEAALKYADKALALDPENKQLRELRLSIEQKMKANESERAKEKSLSYAQTNFNAQKKLPDLFDESVMTVSEMLEKSKKCFSQGDFFGAHYFAVNAKRLCNENDENASGPEKMEREAWEKISEIQREGKFDFAYNSENAEAADAAEANADADASDANADAENVANANADADAENVANAEVENVANADAEANANANADASEANAEVADASEANANANAETANAENVANADAETANAEANANADAAENSASSKSEKNARRFFGPKEMASESWEKLGQAQMEDPTSGMLFFRVKLKAYASLIEGDFLNAYYGFYALSQEDARKERDPDVMRYLELSRNRLLNDYFFTDETEDLAVFESASNVYFAVQKPQGGCDIVLIRGVTEIEGAGNFVRYLRNLEIYSFDSNKNFIRSVKTPYAKMTAVEVSALSESERRIYVTNPKTKMIPKIQLCSISRSSAAKSERKEPQYEFYTNFGRTNDDSPNKFYWPLPYESVTMILQNFSSGIQINPFAVRTLSKNAPDHGFSRETFSFAMLNKIFFPFMILIFLIFIATLAWNYRLAAKAIFKFKWIFILPLFNLIFYFAQNAVEYAIKLANFIFIAAVGADLAFFAEIAFYILLLVAVIVTFLARKGD